ncbi:hypothetical protein SAMN05216570_3398 [Dyella sp. OK004]|uniref:hypothetical protein n=1 Tax=Dyella sp. OK004 TaxID=1855292 RepID=UPI0008EB525E|nr:hypothetical protein [Dyella sp. OK004]SFS16856.1 hypothetical protein SAMN05216570_3398 [Dyella sp. OK004]
MTENDMRARPWVDAWTLVGLVLLLLPLLTMAHELLGHALTCVAVGYRPSELGAYYVECPLVSGWTARIVAMAGTGMDVLLAVLAYLAWRKVERPLPRLTLWIVFAVKGMVAAGYWMFSGATNLGDWGPDVGGGIGPLPWPWLWRGGLFVIGLYAYTKVVRTAIRMLIAMLGGGDQARHVQRQIAMTVYIVGGISALVVSLFNPHGMVITLTSAIASSFGGLAGLFNVAYSRRFDVPAQDFYIGRLWALVAVGVLVTLTFAAALGPTIYLH